MQVLIAAARGLFAVTLCFMAVGIANAGPVEVEADAGVITMVATVEDVDVTRQLVTVVGPNNNWVVVKVGPEHINLIKIQDKITISYADEVAVALRKVPQPEPGDSIEGQETADMAMNTPTAAEQDWVEATPTGDADFSTVEVTDTIAAIDRAKRTITFAGTGGKTRTIAIAPSVTGFNQLQVGDMVVLEVTRAVAVSVTPA